MSTTTSHQPLKSADLDDLKQQQIDAAATTDGRGDIAHVAGNTQAGKAAGYQLPAHEANRLHVELVTSTPNPATRQFEHAKKVVPLTPQEFERMEKNDSFAEYDEVNILHDPRPKARQLADKTGDVVTGSPAEPNKPLATLNDAQMRYHELTKGDAPTDLTLGQLIDKIAELEAAKHAKPTTPAGSEGADKKPLRIKADYQARFKELYDEDAPAEKTVEELKEAIAHKEKEQGA